MMNNAISLNAFEVVVTTAQQAEAPSMHDQLMLCQIALSLIADVRELTAALALATDAHVEGRR